MRQENDTKLDYDSVLIRPKRSTLNSRKDVSLERNYKFRNSDNEYNGIPVMAANMDGVGVFDVADALAQHGLFTCLVKTYSAEELINFFNEKEHRSDHVAMSIGTSVADYNKFATVKNAVGDNLKYLCMDIANGYSEHFVEHVRYVHNKFPDVVIIAGNVVTGEMTEELILAGASIVKVGIGPGAMCTTRIVTGVGYPQLSAVIECADAAHGLGGHVIADGGCTCTGDVSKAFAAGADFVMLGSMLAGHDEGGGKVISKWYNTGEYKYIYSSDTFEPVFEEKKFVQFYGMSSKAANDKHFGGLKEYRAAEGREALVPYRGQISNTVQDLLGGIRSTCTYVGASSLKQLSKRTTFVLVNNQYNKTYEHK